MNEQTNIPTFDEKDKIDTTFHNFEEEAEVSGKLIGIEDGAYGDQYKIGNNNGEIVVGTYGVLKSKIKSEHIGKFIKIVYIGTKESPKTKRKYRDFDVYVK